MTLVTSHGYSTSFHLVIWCYCYPIVPVAHTTLLASCRSKCPRVALLLYWLHIVLIVYMILLAPYHYYCSDDYGWDNGFSRPRPEWSLFLFAKHRKYCHNKSACWIQIFWKACKNSYVKACAVRSWYKILPPSTSTLKQHKYGDMLWSIIRSSNSSINRFGYIKQLTTKYPKVHLQYFI